MINFDDVTNENKPNIIQIGSKFLVLHTKY